MNLSMILLCIGLNIPTERQIQKYFGPQKTVYKPQHDILVVSSVMPILVNGAYRHLCYTMKFFVNLKNVKVSFDGLAGENEFSAEPNFTPSYQELIFVQVNIERVIHDLDSIGSR